MSGFSFHPTSPPPMTDNNGASFGQFHDCSPPPLGEDPSFGEDDWGDFDNVSVDNPGKNWSSSSKEITHVEENAKFKSTESEQLIQHSTVVSENHINSLNHKLDLDTECDDFEFADFPASIDSSECLNVDFAQSFASRHADKQVKDTVSPDSGLGYDNGEENERMNEKEESEGRDVNNDLSSEGICEKVYSIETNNVADNLTVNVNKRVSESHLDSSNDQRCDSSTTEVKHSMVETNNVLDVPNDTCSEATEVCNTKQTIEKADESSVDTCTIQSNSSSDSEENSFLKVENDSDGDWEAFDDSINTLSGETVKLKSSEDLDEWNAFDNAAIKVPATEKALLSAEVEDGEVDSTTAEEWCAFDTPSIDTMSDASGIPSTDTVSNDQNLTTLSDSTNTFSENTQPSFGDFKAGFEDNTKPADDNLQHNEQKSTNTNDDNFGDFSDIGNKADNSNWASGAFEDHQVKIDDTEEDFGTFDSFSTSTIKDDDFGDFNETPTNTFASLSEPMSSLKKVGLFLVDKINNVLDSSFSEEATDTNGNVIFPVYRLMESLEKVMWVQTVRQEGRENVNIWCQLKDTENTKALEYHWIKSFQRNSLYQTLGVDPNQVHSETKKVVPIFASDLGLLEPSKELKESKQDEFKLVDTQTDTPVKNLEPENVPPVDFDWSGSGLKNPLAVTNVSNFDLDFFGPSDITVNEEQSALETELANGSLNQTSKPKPIQPLENILANMKFTTKKVVKPQQLSEEASATINVLPNLSFMEAKVLMFPLKGMTDSTNS